MQSCFCIECEQLFLGDWSEVICPACRGESDYSDDYACGRQARKEKRAFNRKRGPEILAEHGIPYQVKNDGVHLIVKYSTKTVDYWPGTGKFIFRDGGEGKGVFALLKALGVTVKKTEDK